MKLRETLTETWFGEGQTFRRMIIRPREIGGVVTIDGILMDAISPYIRNVYLDLSHAQTLDEAIDIMYKEDFGWYDALTMED
jgi:hypothetical protein